MRSQTICIRLCLFIAQKGSPRKNVLLRIRLGEQYIHENTENQRGCNGSDRNLTEIQGQTADTADEDGRNNEQIAVLFEVNVLNHLQTGNGNEAVQCDADAAHDARRDRVNNRYERREERNQQRTDGGGENRNHGGVAGDCHARDGFTVSGVRAAAEERADHGADTVAEKSAGQTGVFEEVLFNDGRNVLVVGNVFCEYNKRNRNVRRRDGADVLTGQFAERPECFHKGERGNGEERGEGNLAVHEKVREVREINDLERVDACDGTDDGEQGGYCVTGADADDERDQAGGLPAERGGENGHEQSYNRAENAYERTCRGDTVHINFTGLCVTDRVSREGKTDDRNGRTDNNGGHELVDPVDADLLDDKGDDNVYKTCHDRTDNHAEVAESDRGRTGKGGEHGVDEGEGGAEEDRALALGKEEVDERTASCAEQSGRGAHLVADDDGNDEGCRHDGKKLLDGEDDPLTELRLVAGLINEFHKTSEQKMWILTGSFPDMKKSPTAR